MKSIGVVNMLDKLSGAGYLYVPDAKDENTIKELLIGHSIKKVNDEILELDNGVQLEFYGNEGCCCGAGCYDITELNECENAITNVEFTDEENPEDKYGDERIYKIFVYTENQKIKLLQCDGDDGNGYYGTGYHIKVRLKNGDDENEER